MKLALSNLALKADVSQDYLRTLRSRGISGIEVAPTRIAPWEELTNDVVDRYRATLAEADLVVPSLQALLFGINDAQLLGDEAAFDIMATHLKKVARIGTRLGANVGVFGSPRNRDRGNLEVQAAWELGRERFGKLARLVADEGFSLGIEPVPEFYGGNFVDTSDAVIQMVDEVGHEGLCVHFDTGCISLGGGSISDAIQTAGDRLAHFHIAEPKLASLRNPSIDHADAAKALKAINYDHWIAIEMLEPAGTASDDVLFSVDYAVKTYA
ncbi:sugar phosphate isomerase/epimerase family protein [Asticcacaulis excentricus]|uniref:Xylose isomerase domain-containing protein TIM barrel n=1 Tax=Asticcacaulis excentricus (strain ATCC 15261 / DSM 4724 / KCTC 12464 / NCIMB 9791 / VKM B-1370 / CB 48) TaxID=573065 RepID=E8RMP4_ASTEC|nr:sugar phosphate isomerase/epimerase [Asticcacaulis excentricus]ADU13925.1 Xylose isomerase domain-containing protein TIM barrel [Asticcacaulis excentricus CB 48]